MSTFPAKTREIIYPDSDGKPMAESDLHRDCMVSNMQRLKRHYTGRRVYVSGNLLIYYVEGNPKKSFAPDAFVVHDCDPRRRRIFKIWEERKVPAFVLETTSSSTHHKDRVKKKALYAQLRIPEYFLYDPLGDWLDPPLQGLTLKGHDYIPLEPGPDGSIISEQLGIRFVLENGDLAMFDVATGERLLSDTEEAAQAKQLAEAAKNEAQRERAKRQALEEELARLKSTQGRTEL